MLSDLTVEPYRSSSKNKKLFKPRQKNMVAEVLRRKKILHLEEDEDDDPAAADAQVESTAAATTSTKKKRQIVCSYKNKTMEELKRWLTGNALTNPADVKFLRVRSCNLFQVCS
jgi:hypothetical protein